MYEFVREVEEVVFSKKKRVLGPDSDSDIFSQSVLTAVQVKQEQEEGQEHQDHLRPH